MHYLLIIIFQLRSIVWISVYGLPVHSVTLSVHFFLFLIHLLLNVGWQWEYCWLLWCVYKIPTFSLMVVMRSSNEPISCWYFALSFSNYMTLVSNSPILSVQPNGEFIGRCGEDYPHSRCCKYQEGVDSYRDVVKLYISIFPTTCRIDITSDYSTSPCWSMFFTIPYIYTMTFGTSVCDWYS